VFLRGEGPELVRVVWQHAGRFTLAHDGPALEAAAWSRVPTALSRPDGPGVLVALADSESLDWDDLVELGRV
jgi:hypothetical protein